jgi:ABC-type phosphate transport system auxiliary subunit
MEQMKNEHEKLSLEKKKLKDDIARFDKNSEHYDLETQEIQKEIFVLSD